MPSAAQNMIKYLATEFVLLSNLTQCSGTDASYFEYILHYYFTENCVEIPGRDTQYLMAHYPNGRKSISTMIQLAVSVTLLGGNESQVNSSGV